MNNTPAAFLLVLTASLLAGCGYQGESAAGRAALPTASYSGPPPSNLIDACISNFDPAVDYFPDKTAPRFARYFKVSYHGHYKLVEASLPAVHGRDLSSDKMALVQCGAPAPELTGVLEGAAVIEVPAMTAAANEDGNVIAVVELGLEDRIVAMGGGGVYHEPLRRRHEAGEIVSIGYSFHQSANIEPLVALRPGAIFLLVPSLQWATGFERMRRLGLNAIPTFARDEPSYLGNAEWIKFSSLFFNTEAKANEVFDRVAARSEHWSQATAGRERPLAVWAEIAEPGFWNVLHKSRESEFLQGSGARLIWDRLGPERVIRMSDETLIQLAADADFWITGDQTSQRWNPAVTSRIKAYRSGQVYHHHKRAIAKADAYDWYETPVVRPDLVLRDLVSLFHPELEPDHESLFFEALPGMKRR
ncbi:MAG: ABC transporter substrate-binding protein [Bryobacterales bacterium]|nr:ABC transporter substrate-binding protein [Bryobacterales bacterium]